MLSGVAEDHVQYPVEFVEAAVGDLEGAGALVLAEQAAAEKILQRIR